MSSSLGDQSESEVLFISHSSADVEYVKELVELLNILNIPIVCSSLPGHHIENDRDIYDYLAEKMRKKGRVIFLLSKNYYESAACLNEMGACWILGKEYSTILTPNFDFQSIDGAINPRQMSFKLNDKMRLLELFDSIKSEFKVTDSTTFKVNTAIDKSLKKINALMLSERLILNKPQIKIEGIKGDAINIVLKIRIINSTPKKIIVNSIRVRLVDEYDKSLSHEFKNESISLHPEENRIFDYYIPFHDSEYNRYFDKTKEIDFSYDIDW